MCVPSERILGVRVDCLDLDGALGEIERLIADRGPLRQVVTVNPEFVMLARRDETFGRVLERSELCLADGAGVVWALRRRGCKLRDRAAGSDLVPALAATCASRGWRPFFLGARPGVAAEAARRLTARHSGLQVAGVHSGSPRPEDDEESVDLINEARPDLLLVAYGHPRQELWIDRNRDRLRVPLAIGVGGSFDFIAGRARRAPRALRRIHLEWLWRLALEPWRLRRMSVLPLYAIAVLTARDR